MRACRLALAVVAAGFSLASVAQPVYSDWDRRMKISFPLYDKGEVLTNLPVLVTFQDGVNGFLYADLASPADGADLRFAASNETTELAYEIETWDTAGVSAVWVRLDELAGTNSCLFAYWGMPGAEAPAARTNGSTWAAGYRAVWHMGDAGSIRRDSTPNGWTGAVDAAGVAATGGLIGNADAFTGTASGSANTAPASGGINCGNVSVTGSQTIALWIRAANTSQRRNPINKAYGGEGTMTIETSGSVTYFYGTAGSDATAYQLFASPSGTAKIDEWVHLALVRDLDSASKTVRWYVNGQQVAFAAATYPAAKASVNPFRIGKGYVYCFNGLIDEVQLSETARSSNWVWASWLNMASNDVFNAYSTAESQNLSVPLVANGAAATNRTDSGGWVDGSLTRAGEAPPAVWVFWDTNNWGTNKLWSFSHSFGEFAEPTNLTWLADGLPANTLCFYTYYASNSFGDGWAAEPVAFKTWGPPEPVNADPPVRGYTNAVLAGVLANGGGAWVSFAYGLAPDDLSLGTEPVWVEEGPFTISVGGLLNDTSYYFRAYASNAYGTAWASGVGSFATPVQGLLWTGAGANALASNSNNWENGIRPQNGDAVRLDGTTNKSMTWDLSNVVLRAWNQDEGYTGVVTVLTRYPGRGPFTNMIVTGNLRVDGGVLTHVANSGGANAIDRLMITVGGDLIVGTNGQINVSGRGYSSSQGPGGAVQAQNSYGASHGGMGGHGAYVLTPKPTYGCPYEPETLGSAGDEPGGGAVRLAVGGTATILGAILADGMPDGYRYAGGAGGSILLEAARLEGNGLIRAAGRGCLNGTDASGAGGGGRIAVWLTGSEDFGSVTIEAPSIRDSANGVGACGTVYLQKPGQAKGEGVLRIDNQDNTLGHIICTLMPQPTDFNEAPDLTRLEALILTNKAVLGLNTNTVFDFGGSSLRVDNGNTAIALFGGEGLAFPDPFILSTNYTLFIDGPVSAPGSWVVPAGVKLSHHANQSVEAFKLQLALGGNLTVEAGGAIDVEGRGYKLATGPAAGGGTGGFGASHGGMGGESYAGALARATLGSVLAPANIGSGSSYAGNGAILLDIHGTTTVHGLLSASRTNNAAKAAGPAGGSIRLRTRALLGDGVIDASGTPSSYSSSGGTSSGGGGGGGRISIVLTEGDSFGNVQVKAAGGRNTTVAYRRQSGAAGTVYTETAAQAGGRGRLLVANDNYDLTGLASNTYTLLPAVTNAVADELNRVTLVVSNQAYVALSTNLAVGDLFLVAGGTNRLYLKGFTLRVKSRYHADWGVTNDVVYDGGQIVWGAGQGTIMLLR